MANQLWAEVYNPTGSRLGIVSLASASITRPLDAAGQLTLSVPTTDRNAVDLLQAWRQVRVYWDNPRRGKTLVGSGILMQKNLSAGGTTTAWQGMDTLEALRRINTLRGLQYNNQAIEDVVKDLLNRAGGWSLKAADGLGNTSRRFDATTILKALLDTVTGAGLHLRLIDERRVEVGAFGADSGLRLTNLPVPAREANINSRLVIIQSLSLVEDSYAVVNWIEPVWGNGDAVLTLKRSTRISPYTIQTITGNDGRDVYYLADSASIAAYGVVQRTLPMTSAPYIASDGGSSLINGANVLYDWAVTELQRLKEPQVSYNVSGIKLDKPLLPGDKIRLAYRGEVTQLGVPVQYADINDYFYVLSVSEQYGLNGQTVSLQISNVDKLAPGAAEMIVESLIQTQMASLKQTLTSTAQQYSTSGTIAPGAALSLELIITNSTVDIGRAILTVTRDTVSAPDTIRITINGVDQTAALGGPWLSGITAGLSFSVDIDAILFADGVQGDHTVEISALLRSGNVNATLEVVEVGLSG